MPQPAENPALSAAGASVKSAGEPTGKARAPCAAVAFTLPADGWFAMVTERIFEAALGISTARCIAGMNFEPQQRKLSIRVDFEVGSRFAVPGQAGEHPARDTVTETYPHLNFFQLKGEFEVRVPRVNLPDGKVALITPPRSGKLSGFTLVFEPLVPLLARKTTFTGAARISGPSVHRDMALCEKYVNEAARMADLSEARRVPRDEISRANCHEYVLLFADSDPDPAQHWVIFLAEGIELADDLRGEETRSPCASRGSRGE